MQHFCHFFALRYPPPQFICLIPNIHLGPHSPSATRYCLAVVSPRVVASGAILPAVRCSTSLAKFCAEINAGAVASEIRRPPSSEKPSLPPISLDAASTAPSFLEPAQGTTSLRRGHLVDFPSTRLCRSTSLACLPKRADRIAFAGREWLLQTVVRSIGRSGDDNNVYSSHSRCRHLCRRRIGTPSIFWIVTSTVWRPAVVALRL